MFAKKAKVAHAYEDAHDVIQKLTKKKYSDISKPEYIRKVRHYHAVIAKYKKTFGVEPRNVIKMS